MVDFRYHLVTIIAIFLALAVGIVVGTTALNGPVLDGLRARNAGLIGEKRAAQADVDALKSEVDTADAFARTLAPDLVGGRLDGQSVLLVLTPDADRQVAEQLSTALTEAGALVTGRLSLQPALLEPGSGQLVDDLVASVVTPGLQLPEGAAVARAATQLAAALLVRPGDEPLERDAVQQVVSAFEEADLVQLDDQGEQIVAATTAVLLTGRPPVEQEQVQDDGRQAQLEGLLSMARSLEGASGGAVVAGPTEAAKDGGLVRAVRSDSALDAAVSSVDNVHRAVGQVAVVRALAEQLQGGAGRYGGTGSASAPVPPAAPPAAE